MIQVRGTPVNIDGKSTAPAGQPGQAPTTGGLRVAIPVPAGRQKKTASGAAPLVPATTFARYLRISNVDATNILLVSFLDGIQVQIAKGTSAEFSGEIPFFVVQAKVAAVDWEAFAIVAA